jgi:hypothetical protein
MFVPFKKQGCHVLLPWLLLPWLLLLLPWLLLFCADADFLVTAKKGMLAAPAAVALSSCRRVRTPCRFFMACLPSNLVPQNPEVKSISNFRTDHLKHVSGLAKLNN